MKKRLLTHWCMTVALAVAVVLTPTFISADGDGVLADPSIDIAVGTGIVVGGVGMFSQPGMLTVDVPADATVEQVLLYWAGRGTSDDTLLVEMFEVVGEQIGIEDAVPLSTAFRADITDMNLVGPGLNTLMVEDLTFSNKNDGVGIVVIISGTAETAAFEIRDGLDFAYIDGPNPLNFDTIAQTFTFEPSAEDRTGTLYVLLGDGTEPRADEVQVAVGGNPPEILCDEARGRDGSEWDTAEIPVLIGAGEWSVTIQLFSRELNCFGVGAPDSLSWVVAALSVPIPPPFCGDEILDDGEFCDPPGSIPDSEYPNNVCRDDCTYCGDGEVNGGEECDFNDPNAPENCNPTCELDAICGDGEVNAPGETCDPPGSTPDQSFPDNTCREDCTYCGDGIQDFGEECDFNDPNAPENCNEFCMLEQQEFFGCTPGFWKTNPFAWEGTTQVGGMGPYSPGMPIVSVFSQAAPYAGSDTLIDGLRYGGGSGATGGARNLLRAAIAALLNATHPTVNPGYAFGGAQIIAEVNAALATGDRTAMLNLAYVLDFNNNGADGDSNDDDCPLDADESMRDRTYRRFDRLEQSDSNTGGPSGIVGVQQN